MTLSPFGSSAYEYITTTGGLTGIGEIPGVGGTNGSLLKTPVFSANAGDALNFYFNYVTSDGAGFTDYAWAELVDTSLNPVALLFTARTGPSASFVPGNGLPPSFATLTPSPVPIYPGAPRWSPLGSSSGQCFPSFPTPNCGYTGWVDATYTIEATGNYILEFGVTNYGDTSYDSGLAIDGVTIAGVPVGSPVGSPVPEPGTSMLVGTGAVALALIRRYRRPYNRAARKRLSARPFVAG